MSDETVKLSITIDIQQHDPEADTGLTVTEWNALTDDERSDIRASIWDAMASFDNGGSCVVTDGAKGI